MAVNKKNGNSKKNYRLIFLYFGAKCIGIVAFRGLPTASASHSLRATSILGAKQTPRKHSNANS
jgi:hypothetical protein